ncbi:hypothetical protein B4U80_09718 [Leptotrombidium deliense]|uniref:M-phase phosphoprotein 6-like protein n=1 Tax=Leptotrombidium deliense TaxID=299467 RepID=A0A443SUF9_9ACAR|nr:hypothetical protein B4U80_09718 [Leptotrombidium deliense]
MAKKFERLSKNLRQMKFMQRSKIISETATEEENVLKKVIESSGKEMYTFLDGFEFCENLKYGRMSFKGMNIDIEKLMKENETEEDVEREEVDVTREQMTKRMLNESEISESDRHKRPKRKRTKYIRPVDDN